MFMTQNSSMIALVGAEGPTSTMLQLPNERLNFNWLFIS